MLQGISSNKIALIIALLGIILLFAFEQGSELLIKMRIGEVSKKNIGQSAIIAGRVLSFRESEKTMQFELYDGNKISAVKFNPSTVERALIREKQFVQVAGKVAFYNKKIEIIAEKVEEWTSR